MRAMTREQILEIAKPILFSPPMVRAIADDHKTATRRVIKPQPSNPHWNTIGWLGWDDGHGRKMREPYQPGDFLWVRETWCECATIDSWLTDTALFAYKADYLEQDTPWKWRPSIHMPKAAARLFLRVTDVRVERLQDSFFAQGATIIALQHEGVNIGNHCLQCIENYDVPCCNDLDLALQMDEAINADENGGSECGMLDEVRSEFARLWDSLCPKGKLPVYGWHANPWVRVIKFERIVPS